MESKNYKIVRLYQQHGKRSRIIKHNITRKEAVAHCKKKSSKGKHYFDTWTKE